MTERDRDISDTVAALGAILKRVEDQVSGFAASAGEIANLRRDVSEAREEIRRIHSTLHVGNGRPSMAQRLFVIEQGMEEMKRANDKSARERFTLVTAIITTVGAIVTTVIATFGGA